MMSKLLQSVALAASMVVATSAVQAQELKIGYVNSEAVLRESNLAKLAQAKLEAEFGKREKDLKDQESKLRAAAEKLEKDAPTLSEAAAAATSARRTATCSARSVNGRKT
jgi:outer membrane protein